MAESFLAGLQTGAQIGATRTNLLQRKQELSMRQQQLELDQALQPLQQRQMELQNQMTGIQMKETMRAVELRARNETALSILNDFVAKAIDSDVSDSPGTWGRALDVMSRNPGLWEDPRALKTLDYLKSSREASIEKRKYLMEEERRAAEFQQRQATEIASIQQREDASIRTAETRLAVAQAKDTGKGRLSDSEYRLYSEYLDTLSEDLDMTPDLFYQKATEKLTQMTGEGRLEGKRKTAERTTETQSKRLRYNPATGKLE